MKLALSSTGRLSPEELARNESYARSLGFPRYWVAKGSRLAVVGGGPSIGGSLDEIASADDVWAINGAWQYLKGRGIDAAFFTIDQSKLVLPMCEGAERAVLATCCDPRVLDSLIGADLMVVPIGSDGYCHGSTTATAAPFIALKAGYTQIEFYGCESSFDGLIHAYDTDHPREMLHVKCNGEDFLTNLGLMMQAEVLAKMIRLSPFTLVDKSGGLLSATIADPDIDVLAATPALHQQIMESRVQ